jgi:hypothetical protein
MGDITITVSGTELKLLLKHVALANWMLEAHKTEKDAEGRENEAFFDKILALAHANGVADGIVYDKELRGYFLTEEKEEEYDQYIDPYDKETFWNTLQDELTMRDFIEKHGEKAVAAMDSKTRFKLLEKEAEKYYQEFTKNGIKNLRIVK